MFKSQERLLLPFAASIAVLSVTLTPATVFAAEPSGNEDVANTIAAFRQSMHMMSSKISKKDKDLIISDQHENATSNVSVTKKAITQPVSAKNSDTKTPANTTTQKLDRVITTLGTVQPAVTLAPKPTALAIDNHAAKQKADRTNEVLNQLVLTDKPTPDARQKLATKLKESAKANKVIEPINSNKPSWFERLFGQKAPAESNKNAEIQAPIATANNARTPAYTTKPTLITANTDNTDTLQATVVRPSANIITKADGNSNNVVSNTQKNTLDQPKDQPQQTSWLGSLFKRFQSAPTNTTKTTPLATDTTPLVSTSLNLIETTKKLENTPITAQSLVTRINPTPMLSVSNIRNNTEALVASATTINQATEKTWSPLTLKDPFDNALKRITPPTDVSSNQKTELRCGFPVVSTDTSAPEKDSAIMMQYTQQFTSTEPNDIENNIIYEKGKTLIPTQDKTINNQSYLDVTQVDVVIKSLEPSSRNYPPKFANGYARFIAEDTVEKLINIIRPYAQANNPSFYILLRAAKLESMARNLEMGEEHYSLAVNYINRALSMYPQSGEANFWYGNMISESGGMKESMHFLDQAIKSHFFDAYLSKASAYLALEDQKSALECFDQYTALKPSDPKLSNYLANINLHRYYIW